MSVRVSDILVRDSATSVRSILLELLDELPSITSLCLGSSLNAYNQVVVSVEMVVGKYRGVPEYNISFSSPSCHALIPSPEINSGEISLSFGQGLEVPTNGNSFTFTLHLTNELSLPGGHPRKDFQESSSSAYSH